MRIIDGIKGTTIIDDSYNSSPAAVMSALETLEELNVLGSPAQSARAGRKIAVLGDMAELGEYSERAHKSIGAKASQVLDVLVTVGVKARMIALGALEYGMNESNILQFDDSRKAGKYVESILSSGDTVLVKGSQSIRTEKAVEEIMARPENKENLLVRQEKEWQSR
jgi:UDP-N-acetylmuramoyl-tripeptide--D-alanyl-D-alanine ligase